MEYPSTEAKGYRILWDGGVGEGRIETTTNDLALWRKKTYLDLL